MRYHWKYLLYVLRHKYFVLIGCLKLGVPPWQALLHDWSKFLPIEWFAYVDRMKRGKHSTWHDIDDTPAYDWAWRHHKYTNKHHWEFWLKEPKNLDEIQIGDVLYIHSSHGIKARGCGEVVEKSSTALSIEFQGIILWFVLDDIAWIVQPMPEKYVREMVADWYGAGNAQGKPDIKGWYHAHSHRRVLHPETQKRVEALLDML